MPNPQMKTTALTPLQWKGFKDALPSKIDSLRVGIIVVWRGGCEMLPQVAEAFGQTVVSTIALHTDAEELAASLAEHRLYLRTRQKKFG